MADQNVLLVSPFFYPESISTGRYNTALAQALAMRGASVTVIASHPLYPGWKPVQSSASLQGIVIKRGGSGVWYPRTAVLRRLVLESWFTVYSFWRALLLRKRFDVVVGILPPSLFAIPLAKLFPNARKIGIVHDLQGVHAKAHGGLIARIAGAIERTAFKRFDQLIFLSKSMAARATEGGEFEPSKVRVCYPFVTLNPGLTSNALGHLFPSRFRHVVYSGALGKKQNPSVLLKAFQSAAQRLPGVMFHIFSEGPTADALKAEYGGRNSGQIVFHDLVSEEHLAELYARSDVQVVPQAEKTSDGAFPSKIPNLLASGCAVLAICDAESELNDVIRKSGTGLAHNDWQVEGIVGSLKELLSRASIESHAARARAAEPLVREMFDLTNLVDCVLDSVSACASEVSEPVMSLQGASR